MVRCKMKQPSENNHMLLMIWKGNLHNPNLPANLEVQEFASQVVVLTKDLASFSTVLPFSIVAKFASVGSEASSS